MPHIGHWRYDPAADEVRWDTGMAAVFGLPVGRAPRRIADFLALVHPDDRPRIEQVATRAATVTAVRHQYRTVLADGSERWILDEGHREGDVLVGRSLALGSSADALRRYAVLLEAGQALDAAQSSEAAVDVLVRLLVDRLGDLAVVGLTDGDGPHVAAHAAADERRRAALDVLARGAAWDAGGALAEVLRTGTPRLVLPSDDGLVREREAGEDVREAAAALAGHGFAIAPLVAHGAVAGALVLGRAGTLGEADLALVADLGRRAGLSLDALTRLEREQALRRAAEEAGAQLDQLVEAAPIGIAFLDTDLRYRRTNAALERINGRTAEEHLGRRPSDVLAAGGREVEAALAHALASGELVQQEVRVRFPTAPDHDRSFVVGLYRVALPGGEPLGVAATVFEVTDRNAAEAALQAQRDMYARLLEAADSLGEGVFVISGSRIEWVNDAACRVAGRSAEALVALPSIYELVSPAHREVVADKMLEVLTSGEAVRFDAQLRRPDGSDVWVEVAGRALLADGEPRVIGVARDIDARKQAEIARERDHRRTQLLADLAGLLEASLDLRALLGGTARLLVERAVCAACAFDIDGHAGPRRVAVAPDRADLDEEAELPLVSGGRTVGRMVVDGPVDPALVAELAARVAPVVVNAQLFEERARVARVLQESLLPPRLPAVPGVTVATRYVPGAARLDVGGDFYDLFASAPGVWNAVVGDVCGKGAEAAALTALARHTMRALAGSSTDPGTLLEALNAAILREDLPPERFITVVAARLVPTASGLDLDVACAGHPAPLLVRAAGAVDELGSAGPLLGVAATSRYRPVPVSLAPGDVLVMFTDGLSEAARGRTDDSYRGVAARARPDGPEAVAAALEAWATDQRGGGEAADDLALLVLGA